MTSTVLVERVFEVIVTPANASVDTALLGPDMVQLLTSPAQGPRGLEGPDPWLEPIQSITVTGGLPLVIDYSLGKHIRLTLNGSITALSVINWPPANAIARLTLEIINSGGNDILLWPADTYWAEGIVPLLTQDAGARDRIIFSTTDSGAVIYGDPVGFNYLKP